MCRRAEERMGKKYGKRREGWVEEWREVRVGARRKRLKERLLIMLTTRPKLTERLSYPHTRARTDAPTVGRHANTNTAWSKRDTETNPAISTHTQRLLQTLSPRTFSLSCITHFIMLKLLPLSLPPENTGLRTQILLRNLGPSASPCP